MALTIYYMQPNLHKVELNAGIPAFSTGPSRTEKQKAGLIFSDRPLDLIPAVTYVPTQLPVQYHRPGEA